MRVALWQKISYALFTGSALLAGGGAAVGAYPYLFPPPPPTPTEPQIAQSLIEAPATTTPQRVLAKLTIPDAVPQIGKFIAADLVQMKLHLYEDGVEVGQYPIRTKGRPGTPWETPSGYYSVLTKERNHVNWGEGVHMPYSMEFYGNYFIHGWPHYHNGTPVSSSYSGGCIRLSTDDAAEVFRFANVHTPLFVYDAPPSTSTPSIALGRVPPPPVTAASYLVADLDTGDVYLDKEPTSVLPIADVTKLVAALVANETIMFDRTIRVPADALAPDGDGAGDAKLRVGDTLYPLLMASSDTVANRLAAYYGEKHFVNWMNTTALALNMQSTRFTDPSGESPENISTAEDLYRLAWYLAHKKSFILKITRTPAKVLTGVGGATYHLTTRNPFAAVAGTENSETEHNIGSTAPIYLGGTAGASQSGEAMLGVFSTNLGGTERRIAIAVLGSADHAGDAKLLLDWFNRSALAGVRNGGPACATCALPHHYRKLEL